MPGYAGRGQIRQRQMSLKADNATENRVIKFTYDELMTALFRHNRCSGGLDQPGMPTKIELFHDGKITARLHMSHQDPITCDAAQIAAALILFCIRQKIPLPKNATKSIHVEDDNIVLSLESGDRSGSQTPA